MRELQGHPDNLSNSELYIDYFAEISSNIGSFWSSAPNEIKVDFQELVFSDGVVYDVTKEIYRTPKINSLFLMTAELTEKNKTGNNDENTNNSRSVHKSVQLSNSLHQDLENLSKFYDKHKSTLFQDSSVSHV